jgi:hypothetical protein
VCPSFNFNLSLLRDNSKKKKGLLKDKCFQTFFVGLGLGAKKINEKKNPTCVVLTFFLSFLMKNLKLHLSQILFGKGGSE